MNLRRTLRAIRELGLRAAGQAAWDSFEPVIGFRNRRVYRRLKDSPFSFVGLMLSRECGARCLFCPIRPGTTAAGKLQYMPESVAESVLNQLAEHAYAGEVNLGENGDALMNPAFGRIVAMVNERVPQASMALYSNMMNLTPERAEELLRRNLRSLTVNIDGATARTYRVSKPGLDFERVTGNLRHFIRLRNELRSRCSVNITVISPCRYLQLRRDGRGPAVPYDAPEVFGQWGPLLGQGDSISEPVWLFAWNKGGPRRPKRTHCPPLLVGELLSNLFVSTEGDAYVCCLDPGTAMTYGNVLHDSVYTLWSSERRRELVASIVGKRFNGAGAPCASCAERYDYAACALNLAALRAEHRTAGSR